MPDSKNKTSKDQNPEQTEDSESSNVIALTSDDSMLTRGELAFARLVPDIYQQLMRIRG